MGYNHKFVLQGLTQNVKMDHKKRFHKSLKTLHLLPMLSYKNTSNADIEPRERYNFCETLLGFEDPEARDRMRNKREIEILTNACFSAIDHAEGLMSVEQSIKSKSSKVISSQKKAIIMLHHPLNLTCKWQVYQLQLQSTPNGTAVLVTL